MTLVLRKLLAILHGIFLLSVGSILFILIFPTSALLGGKQGVEELINNYKYLQNQAKEKLKRASRKQNES